LRLVYVRAPKRPAQERPRSISSSRANVTLLAVDEAHCIAMGSRLSAPNTRRSAQCSRNWGGRADGGGSRRRADARRPRTDILDKLFCLGPAGPCSCMASTAPTCAWRCAPGPAVRTPDCPIFSGSRRRPERHRLLARRAAKTEELARVSCARNGINMRCPYHARHGERCAPLTATRTCFLQEDGVRVMVANGWRSAWASTSRTCVFVLHCRHGRPISRATIRRSARAGRDGLPADTLTL